MAAKRRSLAKQAEAQRVTAQRLEAIEQNQNLIMEALGIGVSEKDAVSEEPVVPEGDVDSNEQPAPEKDAAPKEAKPKSKRSTKK